MPTPAEMQSAQDAHNTVYQWMRWFTEQTGNRIDFTKIARTSRSGRGHTREQLLVRAAMIGVSLVGGLAAAAAADYTETERLTPTQAFWGGFVATFVVAHAVVMLPRFRNRDRLAKDRDAYFADVRQVLAAHPEALVIAEQRFAEILQMSAADDSAGAANAVGSLVLQRDLAKMVRDGTATIETDSDKSKVISYMRGIEGNVRNKTLSVMAGFNSPEFQFGMGYTRDDQAESLRRGSRKGWR